MFKKAFFIISIFLFFLFLIFILIFLNINSILNSHQVKEKFSKFLKKNYAVELDYERVKINLLQQKVFIKNLSYKSLQYEVFLPEGNFTFSFSKLLRLNFIPTKFISENGYLKIHRKKKPFHLKEFAKNIAKLSPIYLAVNNMTLDYETPVGWVNLKNFNLRLRVNREQALYEADSESNLFEKVTFKGRFNYKKLFSENSLEVKNLNLSKLQRLSDYGIFKTILNLKSEIVLEKDTLNVAFAVLNPYLFLKRVPSKKLLGGYLEGLIVANKDKIKITLDPLIVNYPKINGSIDLTKNKKGYKILASVKEFNLSDIENLLPKLFPENEKIKKVLAIVKGGNFYDIKIETSGRNIKDVFKLKNLVLKATLKKGKIKISKLPFDFENIQGELIFEKNILQFGGSASLNKNTFLKVKKLSLNFKEKNPLLFIDGDFYTSAEEVTKIISQFVKSPEIFKNYEFNGDLKGIIKLTGNIPNIEGKIKFFLDNVAVKTPYYSNPIKVKRGRLIYDFDNKIFAKNLAIFSTNSYVKELTGELDLKSFNINVSAKNIWVFPEIIEELSKKNKKIKNFISKYNIFFKNIHFDYLKYKDNLGYLKNKSDSTIEHLKKNIIAKGNLTNLVSKVPYKGETFKIKIEKLPFEYEKGRFVFNNALIYLEDSDFSIEGEIYNKQVVINGSGELKKELENKIKNLSDIFSKFSVKVPVKFDKFKILYDSKALLYSGIHIINGLSVSLDLNKTEEFFDINLGFLSEKSDLKVQLKKQETQTSLKTEGKLNLKDLSKLIGQGKHNVAGKLECSLNLKIPKEFKVKDLKSFFNFYLTSHLIMQNSYLKVDNFRYFYNKTSFISVDFLGNFTDKEIRISNFSLKWNNNQIKGNFNLEKKKGYLYLNGDLFGEKADLRNFIKKEKTSKKSKDPFQILDDIPLIADIKFRVNSLILPTSHQFENISGEISFDNRNKLIIVDIPEIYFCNLSLQAIYEKDLENQYIYVEVLPSKGDFLDLFSCLSPEEMPTVILEGPYNLEGYFYAEGDTKTLIKEATGTLEIRSNKGYIYRAPLLAKILSYLSPIDLFRGKVTNLENDLLEYEELDVKTFFEDTTLNLDTGFLSAVGFRLFGEGKVDLSKEKLNLTFYVSPFKTIDVIIEKIPYLGKWILGKPRMLIYLPLQVTGTYKNYNIVPLHPSSIGKGIFTFIFRIFGIPEEFFKKEEIKEFKKQKLLEKKEKYEKIDKSL